MKKEFSTQWNASRQPRKQRKYLANAPTHIRHKFISANLTKELRKKYGKRNFPLRKGDSIVIMRGEFKGKAGKIEAVDLKKLRVMIGGIYRTKKDGTKVSVYFDNSNLQIKELNMEDKKRINAIQRKNEKKTKDINTETKKITKEKTVEAKSNVPKKK
jgi:large subunit ribosomal protein L24